MKPYLIITVVFLVTATLASAQPKPKQKTKEAPPTAKELEAMMKEAQQEMDNLDPETKRMMDSLGFKMPSMNSLPQVTDAQLQEAYENESRVVPKRDDARIASISKTPLTNSSIGAFILNSHNKVSMRIKSASKAKGEEIYRSVKAQYNSATATGNAAAGLWMMGKSELAIYVMGKACIDNPAHVNNLNNYAAMLSMTGGEALSVPILNFLNKRFPKNSTILNNLGQAWFGLGEIDKANHYLDSVIRIYAYHPQATYTKSFIEESKDHQSSAVDLAKRSIKRSFSHDKESRLNKLGYKLRSEDIDWDAPMPQDPLGLNGFTPPSYPGNVLESMQLEKEWDDFRKKCQQELALLRDQQSKAEAAALQATQKRTQLLLQAGQKGLWVDPIPPLAAKAMVKLKYLVDDTDGHREVSYKKTAEAVANAKVKVADFESKLSAELKALEEKYEDKFGEGRPNPFEAACKDENGVKDAFLSASNPLLHEADREFLNLSRRMISDELYYYQYTMWPEEFEVAKVSAKTKWLNLLINLKPVFRNKSSWCPPANPEKPKPFKLAAFDDVHCNYHSELVTPVGTIRTDCSRMTTQLDLKFLKIGLKQDMDRETFGDQFMSCSVEVGAGTGAGINAGPLKAEASAGAAIAAEFDRNGLRDVILKGSASVSAGSDIVKGGKMAGVGVSDVSVDVGVQGQISIISGISSMGGTGFLSR